MRQNTHKEKCLYHYWLRYLIAWGALLDGVIGILTLSHYNPDFALRAAKRLIEARNPDWRPKS